MVFRILDYWIKHLLYLILSFNVFNMHYVLGLQIYFLRLPKLSIEQYLQITYWNTYKIIYEKDFEATFYHIYFLHLL